MAMSNPQRIRFTLFSLMAFFLIFGCADVPLEIIQSDSATKGPVTSYQPGGPPATSPPKSTNKNSKLTTPVPASNTIKGSVTQTSTLSNNHILSPGKGLVHLAIDLKAAKAKAGKRLPMNLAVVIDRSGSMRGEKIQEARKAARHLVKQLGDNDIISIVSYADNVRVDLSSAHATPDIKKKALDAIGRIHAGGSTNLSGGMFRGQAEVSRNLATGQVNRVILMSDGLANRGITDTKALSLQAQKTSQRGVSVTTMGVGTDYNEDLMTALADSAGGNYYFIAKSNQISGVFTQELRKMFATVAQNTVVEIQIEDGAELKKVFGYTFTRKNDKVVIPLAEIFGGQKRSILIEMAVPVSRQGRITLGKVSLRYNDVSKNNAMQNATVDLAVIVTGSKKLVELNRNRSVEERFGEIQVAAAMTKAADLVKQGRGKEARKVLRDQRKKTAGQATLLGSKRLKKQEKALERLESDFEDSKVHGSPGANARKVKAAKQKARTLRR
jgi:Ca-activated chloride channel family protein